MEKELDRELLIKSRIIHASRTAKAAISKQGRRAEQRTVGIFASEATVKDPVSFDFSRTTSGLRLSAPSDQLLWSSFAAKALLIMLSKTVLTGASPFPVQHGAEIQPKDGYSDNHVNGQAFVDFAAMLFVPLGHAFQCLLAPLR